MIQLKNNKFQDLSNYIPKGFKNSPRCLQTRYTPEDSEAMVITLDHLAKEVYDTFSPTNIFNPSFLPLPQDDELSNLGSRIVWTNKYAPGQFTSFHTHEDPVFTKNANYFAIYIIGIGSKLETVSFIDKTGLQKDIVVSLGDLLVGHCSEQHGALPVNEYLVAMMFKINIPNGIH